MPSRRVGRSRSLTGGKQGKREGSDQNDIFYPRCRGLWDDPGAILEGQFGHLALRGWGLKFSQGQPFFLVSWRLRALGLHIASVSAQADLAQPFGKRVGGSFSTGLGIVRSIFFSLEAIHVLPPSSPEIQGHRAG